MEWWQALEQSVEELPGVGPRRGEQLRERGLGSWGALLHHLPRRYDDHRVRPDEPLLPGGEARAPRTVWGRLIRLRHRRGRVSRWTGEFDVALGPERASERIRLLWFRWPPRIDEGWEGFASGTLRRVGDGGAKSAPTFEIAQPELHTADDPDSESETAFRAVYPAGGGLRSRQLSGWIDTILDRLDALPPARIPEEVERVLRAPDAPSLQAVYRQLHRPRDFGEVETARRILGRLELALFVWRQRAEGGWLGAQRVAPIEIADSIESRILGRLGIELTRGQRGAIDDVRADLARGRPMRRLVQGDVGCGKTTIAVYAALAVVAAGRQVAFLAPTSALAEQHRRRFEELLAGAQLRIGYFGGGCGAKDRVQLRRALREGEIDLAIGTHALLRERGEFRDLGLVIVDEEQRFGVRQREALLDRDPTPHLLQLTATPIPRSLASTLFGHASVSTISELPVGRGPRSTHRLPPRSDRRGQRAVRVALERVTGEASVLIATTIVEVGLDIPELTVVWIENADRLGLATLHQLRGRVGRSERESWCFVRSDAPRSEERLETFCRTDDGFRLAELDLARRGDGDPFGVSQSGVVPFRVVRPLDELGTLARLRAELPPFESRPSWPPLVPGLSPYLTWGPGRRTPL